MPMIDVRDTRLYYEKAGDGEPALLFIHGAAGGAWDLHEQVSRLSDEFTCIAYDRRGHSRSEPGTEDQSNRTHVEDAVALIGALGLDPPVLVGDSTGGEIAIDLLHRYPELARGAVVSEPVLFSLDPQGGEQLIEHVGQKLGHAVENYGHGAAVDTFFGEICSHFWADISEAERDRFRENAPMLFAMLEAETTRLTPDELADIEHPVLVISGSQSVPVIRCVSKLAAEHLPNGRFIEFRDSGHVTHAEQPSEFERHARAFVHEIVGSMSATM